MDRMRTARPIGARARLAGLLAALAGALALGAATAETAAADGFACRGSALRVDALVAGIGADAEPVVANDGSDPCAADARTLVMLPDALRSLVSAGAAQATTAADGQGASAAGRLENATLLSAIATGITLDAVEAEAGYRCVDGTAVPYTAGQVVGLRVLGASIADTAAPTELDVALDVLLTRVSLARLTLNEVTTTPTSVTRTGARLRVAASIDLGLLSVIGLDRVVDALLGRLLGTDIAIGEARASLVGDPCAASAPEPPGPGPTDPGPPTPPGPGPGPGPTGHSPPPPGPGARATVGALPPGCIATHRHGYFINASSAPLGRRRLLFHATTDSAAGTIRLATRLGRGRLGAVAYRLDGRVVARGPRATLRFAQLRRTGRHTLQVTARAGGRRARITRAFRYVDYVDVDCDGREVVGPLAAKVVRVGGARITIAPEVPRTIQGTEKLRFVVRSSRRHALSRVHFALDGRAVRNHLRSVAFTGRQLRADGTQTLTVRLVPRRGRPVTVRVPFRTARV